VPSCFAFSCCLAVCAFACSREPNANSSFVASDLTCAGHWWLQVKLALVRLVKTKGRDHTTLLRRVERLRGDKDMTRKLVEQLAEAARVHRRAALADQLLLLAQLQQ